jgi:hypothetical protein
VGRIATAGLSPDVTVLHPYTDGAEGPGHFFALLDYDRRRREAKAGLAIGFVVGVGCRGRRTAMIELTEEQRQELAGQEQPPAAVDPATGQVYRLIKQEVYQLVKGVVAPFNKGVEDDTEMDVYEQYRKSL